MNACHLECQISQSNNFFNFKKYPENKFKVDLAMKLRATGSSNDKVSARPATLQKLNSFRRDLPFMSQNALQALLQKVHKEGLPEVRHAKGMKEATRMILSNMNAYGPLLLHEPVDTIDGQPATIWMANTMSLLAGLYQQGGQWARLLHETHSSKASQQAAPWKLLLYSDEVCPGNQLSHRLERKTMAIYGSFAEFHNMLQHEDAWFVVSIARSQEISNIQAGISQIFAKVIKSIFMNPVANPRLGVCLPHATDSRQDIRLHFTMGGWIQDGLAMKQTFCAKGDSGTKFCMLCNNIRSMPQADSTSQEEEDIPGSSVSTLAECELATDIEVLAAFQKCHQNSATMSKEQFAIYQQAAGITYNQHSLLLDQVLIP